MKYIYKHKKCRNLSQKLHKQLMQLNTADSLIRHTSKIWLSKLEDDVSKSCHDVPIKNTFIHYECKQQDSDGHESAPPSFGATVTVDELSSIMTPSSDELTKTNCIN